MKRNITSITALKRGSISLNKVYRGTNTVWESGDSDVNAFITATGITDSTQISAVNTLVSSLKTNGLWTKFKAIYPMVGGTAQAHKFNLVNPADTDASFRLTFYGDWVHNSTGAVPNGGNTWAQTHISPATHLNQTEGFAGYYSGDDIVGNQYVEMGIGLGVPNPYLIAIQWNATEGLFYAHNGNQLGGFANNISKAGWYFMNRNGTDLKIDRNNVNFHSTTQSSSGLSSFFITLGCYNNGSSNYFYTLRRCSFCVIGHLGLNDTEKTNLFDTIQTFQTTLGRNIT